MAYFQELWNKVYTEATKLSMVRSRSDMSEQNQSPISGRHLAKYWGGASLLFCKDDITHFYCFRTKDYCLPKYWGGHRPPLAPPPPKCPPLSPITRKLNVHRLVHKKANHAPCFKKIILYLRLHPVLLLRC